MSGCCGIARGSTRIAKRCIVARAGASDICISPTWGRGDSQNSTAAISRSSTAKVSPLLLEKLARKRVGYDVSRWGVPRPYPPESVRGPMVGLTNQYAGSDGDIFSHCFKLYGLGPLVGKRTWGGVIGIWPRHPLVDGTVTTQPEFSFWFVDVGWTVENYGTDPDYDVDIAPHDARAKRDPQMDKAIELVLAALEADPASMPDFSNRPSLKIPTKLPPR
jgi:tricorn protease